MLRHKLWHASQTVWQLNLEAVSLHADPSLPAPPLADGHDRGDRRRDRMRGPRDAGQHAAAPDRDGDGAGRQRLRGGRQALPGGAREGRRGGATSPDRRFGGNRGAAARSPLGRGRRPNARRRRPRREYGRPRLRRRRGLRTADGGAPVGEVEVARTKDWLGGAPVPAPAPAVRAAKRRERDIWGTEIFKARKRFARRGGNRHAAEQGSGALKKNGPAVPARLFSILD